MKFYLPKWMKIVILLQYHNKACDIARSMKISPESVTTTITQLDLLGICTKTKNKNYKIIELTDTGRSLLKNCQNIQNMVTK